MITMVFPYDGHHHYQCVVGAWLDAPPRHTGSVYFSRGILGWWRIHGLRTDQPPTTRRLLRTRPECICWQALIPFTQCLIVVYRNTTKKNLHSTKQPPNEEWEPDSGFSRGCLLVGCFCWLTLITGYFQCNWVHIGKKKTQILSI